MHAVLLDVEWKTSIQCDGRDSRYTVWRMTREGALHPVNVRGSFRYRRAEIEAIANGPVPADDPAVSALADELHANA